MKTPTRIILFLGFILALLIFPRTTPAQTVTCESNDGNRNYCGSYSPDQVSLQRQISSASCVQDKSWGVDRKGLWVDRGCRAVFVIRRGPPPPPPGGPGWIHPGPGNPWPPSGNWNGGNWGKGGACFYRGYNFGGDYFCMRLGESRDSLGSYGGTLSSIRVFGGARVIVFNDRNFSGGQDVTNRDVPDLRQWKMSSKPPHTWNNRISSLKVR